VLSEPTDLDRDALAELLERRWGLDVLRLEHLPVGFGSHHWRADTAGGERLFVTADDLEAPFQAGPDAAGSFAALERAFGAAAALRDEAGLEFVTAPLADRDGRVVHRLGARYTASVSPFLEGSSHPWGHWDSPAEQREMGTLLGRLHRASALVPADRLPRRHDLAIPSRDVLEAALGDLSRDWETGPYAERVRELLGRHAEALARRLSAYDALARRVGADDSGWVVTHGEPHRANVVRDPAGGLHLVDWDTTLLAPRERDLGFVLGEEPTGWEEYEDASGCSVLDRDALRLFRDWWALADVAVFVALFRRPHVESDDLAEAWRNLVEDMPSDRQA
jgi:spectinomycin phosphotransferase